MTMLLRSAAARCAAAPSAARRLTIAAPAAFARSPRAQRATTLAASFSAGAAGGAAAEKIELPSHKDAGLFSIDLLAEQTCLAHPSKKRGEDAWFITRYAVGVADGVGGWAEVNVDAGAYSRQLMEECKSFVDASVASATAEGKPVEVDPTPVLAAAHARVQLPGSTTAVVVTAGHSGTLRILNLGDSAALLLRYTPPPATDRGIGPLRPEEVAKLWSPLFKTTEQQHDTFNMPLQLCHPRYGASDPVSAADRLEASPAIGDVVLLGSDGVFDNLTVPEVIAALARVDWRPCREYLRLKRRRYAEAKAVATSARAALAEPGSAEAEATARKGTPLERFKIRNLSESDVATDAELLEAEKAARAALRSASALVAVAAQRVGRDPRANSPFSRAAAAVGLRHDGGKLDDVTVLLGLVVPDDARPRVEGAPLSCAQAQAAGA